ncbi:MAG: hypothetical protein SGPRY_007959, partial [Prymnesium sp.]
FGLWPLNRPRSTGYKMMKRATEKREKLTTSEKGVGWRTNERASKLLLEIPMRELHNNLIELQVEKGGNGGGLPDVRDGQGKILMSDTVLRGLLPPQLKPATEHHKVMCGCELCEEEVGKDEHSPMINFHVYTNVTECTKRGILKLNSK